MKLSKSEVELGVPDIVPCMTPASVNDILK